MLILDAQKIMPSSPEENRGQEIETKTVVIENITLEQFAVAKPIIIALMDHNVLSGYRIRDDDKRLELDVEKK